MALPKLNADLALVSKLGDYPGSDNNLTAEQFRAVFDQAALIIQSYLNNDLTPNLDMLVDVQALLNGIIDKTLSVSDKAADAYAVGSELSRRLPLSGGTMSGAVNMNGLPVLNVRTPANEGDAANKGYVDSRHFIRTVTLPVIGWIGDGPYTQTVAVKDIQAEDEPHWGLVRSGDTAAKIMQKEAYALVDELDTADGSVMFTCDEEKPEVDLTIQLEVNR